MKKVTIILYVKDEVWTEGFPKESDGQVEVMIENFFLLHGVDGVSVGVEDTGASDDDNGSNYLQ